MSQWLTGVYMAGGVQQLMQAYSAVIQFGGSDMVERASADQATLACDALTIYPLIGLAVLRLQT